MGKRFILSAIVALASLAGAQAQEYVPTPVTVSREKVKLDGKVYYSHVVLEKQTLYGISKAYDVSIEDLYAANESIHLRENGLKKNSIILIPVNKEESPRKARRKAADEQRDSIRVQEQGPEARMESARVAGARKAEEKIAEARDSMRTAVQGETDEARIPQDFEEGDVWNMADTLEYPQQPSYEPKNEVGVMLMLPLKAASGRGSSGYMDFYSGALLAARAKGMQGINVNLTVHDVANGLPSLKEEDWIGTDVVIGPVFYDNMKDLLAKMPKDLHAVSPMDSRTMSLALENPQLIQANGGSDMQYADLVAWMDRERGEDEKTVLIYERGRDSEVRDVEALLGERGIAYSKLSYNILEGMGADVAMKARMEPGKVNRVIIVSDSEAFVNDAVRNLSLLTLESAGGYRICLYGPSKIKNYETIEAENLHNVNLHLGLSYNVNYDDPATKDFLMKYRAIFRTEPTAYAYQGYDLMNFFVSVIAKYGDKWYEWFTRETSSQLQADFKFESCGEGGGYVNTALRHVVYGPEYSMTPVNF